jgi:hypothetical protein
MHLSRLLALGPDVVRPGKLKLELVLTLRVVLLKNDLLCCLVLLPCLDLRLIRVFFHSIWVYFYLFEVREWCGIHSWYISCILLSKNWCKLLKMLAFSRLPPLVNGATPVESHLLLFMNDHKRLGFDFMSSLNIVLT